jgi:hypothetical protein
MRRRSCRHATGAEETGGSRTHSPTGRRATRPLRGRGPTVPALLGDAVRVKSLQATESVWPLSLALDDVIADSMEALRAAGRSLRTTECIGAFLVECAAFAARVRSPATLSELAPPLVRRWLVSLEVEIFGTCASQLGRQDSDPEGLRRLRRRRIRARTSSPARTILPDGPGANRAYVLNAPAQGPPARPLVVAQVLPAIEALQDAVARRIRRDLEDSCHRCRSGRP